MGKRHAAYSVTEAHYGSAEAALLQALEQFLGNDFSKESKEAWKAAYAIMTAFMKEGAAGTR